MGAENLYNIAFITTDDVQPSHLRYVVDRQTHGHGEYMDQHPARAEVWRLGGWRLGLATWAGDLGWRIAGDDVRSSYRSHYACPDQTPGHQTPLPLLVATGAGPGS